MLGGKKILLGLTGSIAAYKAPLLIREFQKQGAAVRCVLTPSALPFVGPQALASLTSFKACSDLFAEPGQIREDHISLREWADALVIAPATANTLAKIAHGICDNLLTSVAMSHSGPLIAAPAMNTVMWKKAAMQDNVKLLVDRGLFLVSPESGSLACGDVGEGRMAELNRIVHWTKRAMTEPVLKGKKVLITAGPTREPFDAVRFVSNHSSGRMGVELAHAAWQAGGEVTLIHGPIAQTAIPEILCREVATAGEMLKAVKAHFSTSRIFIANAAVSDFGPSHPNAGKPEKGAYGTSVGMRRTPDILGWAGRNRGRKVVVGFALDTEMDEKRAVKKLLKKNCSKIVLNRITSMGSNHSEAVVLDRGGGRKFLESGPKSKIANDLILEIAGQ